MPRYVRLIRYTEQGMKTLKNLNERLGNVKKVVESNGGKLIDSYVTLGRYDVISILEAPNDDAAMKISVEIAAQGNLTAETLKAVRMQDFTKLVRK